jgi:DNA-directed RNA polymerase specialized sigma24 family protein
MYESYRFTASIKSKYIQLIHSHLLTIADWTNTHYKLLGEAIYRITSGDSLSEELLHYTLTAFLDRPDTQQIVDTGGGFFFCLRIATNSWKSTTSPFYRLYRDPDLRQELSHSHQELPDQEVTEEPEPFQTLDIHSKIDRELSKLSWYERELAKAYAEHGCNANLLSRVTKIPRTSINLTLSRIRTHVKTNIDHE